jgi:hypothetical protein
MISLIVKLLDLANALLNHFVRNEDGTGELDVFFWQSTDYQWQGDIASVLTPKGNETFGALATVIHMGSMFLAQLMLLFNAEFYNVNVAVSGAAPL